MDYPYKVFDPCGVPVMSAPEELRYPRNLELEMLAAGYTIRLHGRKITKKELKSTCRISTPYEPHVEMKLPEWEEFAK